MILRQLILHNFGGYRGRHVVELTPPSPEQPVVLFGGLNGSGKTTFLDALQLVLYGKRARCSGRANLAYDEYLRRSIHRAVSSLEGAALELLFDAPYDGQTTTFRVHRSWQPSKGGAIRDRLSVERDGEHDELATERWDDVVEEILPLDISSLFFFDGEKIEALADPERAGRVIGTAIETLLGLNLLERLNTDLVALSRRKVTSGSVSDARDEYSRLASEVEAARADREASYQLECSCRTQVESAERSLEKADRTFKRVGGELFDRRTELEQSRAAASERLRALDARLVEVASGSLPLRLITDLLKRVKVQHRSEVLARQAELFGAALEERDRDVVSALGVEIHGDVAERVRELLAADRAERAAAISVPRYLPAHEGLAGRIEAVLPGEIENVAAEVVQLLEQREVLRAQLEEADRLLAAVPDKDAVAIASTRRDECIATLAERRARLSAAIEDRELADRKLAETEAQLERAFKLSRLVSNEEESTRRIVEYAEKVRGTLARFKVGLLDRHLSRIEAAVLDSLKQLLRKQRLVADLRLDPETFELSLFNDDGDLVPTERLSAGERQLLAVAMLWGLARVSGRQLPMVIDTPLGRLDDSHRQLIVKRYFPAASHQVLLLSTDKEIDAPLLAALGTSVGRSYELKHDDVLGSTSVVDGYFEMEGTHVA